MWQNNLNQAFETEMGMNIYTQMPVQNQQDLLT
jgi:hypothetical protein